MSPGKGTEDDWRKEIAFWKKAGVTHITAHTTFVSAIHQRIAGKSYDDHLTAITRYRNAVTDLVCEIHAALRQQHLSRPRGRASGW